MRSFLFIALLAFTALSSSAQSGFIAGFLRDSITHFPISGGTIKNNNSNKIIRTDVRGFFRLAAQPNDLIYAIAVNYQYDTLRYSSLFTDTIQIFLSPSGDILPTVTVTSGYSKYQMDSAERRSEFEENRGTMVKRISRPNSSAFGVGLNLDRVFKQKDKQKKKYTDFYKKSEQQAYIDYRFSPQIVSFYTGLKGDALRLFLYQFTPSYQWLRQHSSNEDVLFYLNEKIKVFKAASYKK